MKQLSSSELNNMSKEDLASMILQMQQLHQQQKQMEQQIHTLNKKIAIMNARHFGRSTEKLETLPGQMNIFNETDTGRILPLRWISQTMHSPWWQHAMKTWDLSVNRRPCK